MRIRVIGAPMDLGADRRGVDIGTSAIRYAEINERLRRLGHSVKDMGNLVIPQPEIQPQGNLKLKYLDPIVGISKELSTIVTPSCKKANFPSFSEVITASRLAQCGELRTFTRMWE